MWLRRSLPPIGVHQFEKGDIELVRKELDRGGGIGIADGGNNCRNIVNRFLLSENYGEKTNS